MSATEFGKDFTGKQLDELAVNTIKCLSIDGVQKAKSGHPGLPMGAADFAYVLWARFLKHNPGNPNWPDRDRFVLSAGHGSMLLYSLLHLAGYKVSLDDLKEFRQWNSLTPGHPEHGHTDGVETTTGPLGQGIGNAVGMALSEAMLAQTFNSDSEKIVDHYTYVLVGDGDLMEGLSQEVISLAGHLGLGKLICFYDSNQITIEGATDLASSDDPQKRFEASNWHVIDIDGHDHEAIAAAIKSGQKEAGKPTLIIGHTTIGKGSPNKEGTAGSHGEPLGEEEVVVTKKNLGFPVSPAFLVPDAVRDLFDERKTKMADEQKKWRELFDKWSKADPEKAKQWDMAMAKELPADLAGKLPKFDHGKALDTRRASGEIFKVLCSELPFLAGGAADLAPSTKTLMKGSCSVKPGEFGGCNLHFGIREHGMGAILNGMALHGGFIVFGATFFVFSDYMRPAVRLAALMKQQVIYVFTHDSIFVGEDGPTHEPIEQTAALRIIPNMTVIRPADAVETVVAWQVALENKTGPTALLLTRQNLPIMDRNVLGSAEGVRKGAYILCGEDIEKPDLLIIASGSEVSIALEANKTLAEKGVKARIINMASWELFDKQDDEYRHKVIPADIELRLGVEAGCTFGWSKYLGNKGRMIGIDHFGASAPAGILAKEFGFTADNIVKNALEMVK